MNQDKDKQNDATNTVGLIVFVVAAVFVTLNYFFGGDSKPKPQPVVQQQQPYRNSGILNSTDSQQYMNNAARAEEDQANRDAAAIMRQQ